MTRTGSSETLSPAADAFAEFLDRIEEDPGADFAAFCARRPELAPALRRLHDRWLELRSAMEGMGGPDAGPPGAGAHGDPSTARLLERLRAKGDAAARYEVRGEIARGGMGRVLRVFDTELRRGLAMKVLADGGRGRFDSRALSRFLEEAHVTGQLEHPGIVPVHELGLDAEGRIYFTMPFVRGESFEAAIEHVHARAPDWTLARALGVLERVCEAVGYAHARGVIHRDLKPSNVMVGEFGETYVMDWGLASVLGGEGEQRLATPRSGPERALSPFVTMQGDVVGTPAYMPPEQARGAARESGPASDVYAIGAMLYHLLAGHPPYGGLADEERGESSTVEVLEAVKHGPPRPLHAVAPDVPAELAAIQEKAMAREPAARYAGAMELAGDLRAFLEGRVVRAYETGAWAELRKWMRRNRRFAAASLVALVAVLGGLAASTSLWVRAEESARVAEENEDVARAQQALAEQRAAEALAEKERADAIADRLATEVRANNVERGRLLGRAGPFARAEELLWLEFLRQPFEPHATWTLRELHVDHPCLATVQAAEDGWVLVAFGPEGELLTLDEGGWLRAWSADGRRALRAVAAHEGRPGAIAVAADGRTVATGGHPDGRLRTWDPSDLAPLASVDAHAGGVTAADVRPDGARVATTGADGRLREWSLPDLAPVRALDLGEGETQAVRYLPDGKALLVATVAGRAHLVPAGADAPARSWQVHGAPALTSVEVMEDGERAVSGSRGRELRTWRLDEDEALVLGRGDNGTIRDVLALADGETVVSGGWYRLDFHAPAALETRRSYHLPSGVSNLAQSPDGRTIAVGTAAGRARIFESRPRGGIAALTGSGTRSVAAFRPDGRVIATGDAEGTVRSFDARTGALLESRREHRARVACLGFSGDGDHLVTADVSGVARVRHLPSGALPLELEGLEIETSRAVDLTPDGRTLVAVLPDARVGVFDVATGRLLATVRHDTRQALSVLALPERGGFASAAREHSVRFWTFDAEPAGVLELGATPWTMARDPRPGAGRMAVGEWSWHVVVADVSGAPTVLQALKGHWGTVWAAAFHPAEAELLASCGDDATARLWDLATGHDVVALDLGEDLGNAVSTVEFSPDGRALLIGGGGDPLVLDLEYYDRHLAGNALHQLERLRDRVGVDVDEAALAAWADAVLARPWPRLSIGRAEEER